MAPRRSAICCICRRASISARRQERGTRSQPAVARHGARRPDPKGTDRQHRSVQPADRAAGDALLLRQHRARCARPRSALRRPANRRPNICSEKIWQPIGTEADAKWLIDAEGFEVAHFGFNAVLRDYARLGRLLAHDGAWDGKQIIPAQWMIEATTMRPSDALSRAGKDRAALTRLWLSDVAAAGDAAPVRADRRSSASASASIRPRSS